MNRIYFVAKKMKKKKQQRDKKKTLDQKKIFSTAEDMVLRRLTATNEVCAMLGHDLHKNN